MSPAAERRAPVPVMVPAVPEAREPVARMSIARAITSGTSTVQVFDVVLLAENPVRPAAEVHERLIS